MYEIERQLLISHWDQWSIVLLCKVGLKTENVEMFPLAGSVQLFYQYFGHETLSSSNVSPRGAAISIRSLTNKEQDRVGSWRNVHSCNKWLAWTWCYTLGQNGGAHYRVFAISKRQFYEIEHNFVSFLMLVSVDHLILEDRTRYPLSLDAPLTSRIGDSSQSLAQFM